jgi:glycosyltransferase involved in cell wall biosynthesis
MKILIIIPGLQRGGAEIFVVDLINELVRNDNVKSIILLVYSTQNEKGQSLNKVETHSKIKVIDLNVDFRYGRPSHLKALIKIYKTIVHERPDIINSHLSVANDLALLYSFLKPVKFFHTIHSQALKEAGIKSTKSLYFSLRKYYYTRKHVKLVSISKSVKESIEDLYNVDSVLIMNGSPKRIKTNQFDSVAIKINNLKTAIDTKIFLAVGNLRSEKNYPFLINVFNRLYNEKKVDAKLIVLGESTSDLSKEDLQKQSSNNIYFLGGVSNVQDYMINADFLCMPSLYEGMPITLIEAFSQKLIPIVTPSPGIIDMIIHNQNGIISENASEESYYNAIQFALNLDENEKTKMRKNAYDIYMNEYIIAHTSEKYFNQFKQAIQ